MHVPLLWCKAAAICTCFLETCTAKAKSAVCLLSGYNEDQYSLWQRETTQALEEVFGAEEQDIRWVTPVRDEHFTYHGSILAGTHLHELKDSL